VKGKLIPYIQYDDVQTTGDDEKWIQEKLALLAKKGLAEDPKAARPMDITTSQRWFSNYWRQNGTKKRKKIDFTAIEKKHKVTLPQDYKEFVTSVDPKSFPCVTSSSETRVMLR